MYDTLDPRSSVAVTDNADPMYCMAADTNGGASGVNAVYGTAAPGAGANAVYDTASAGDGEAMYDAATMPADGGEAVYDAAAPGVVYAVARNVEVV